MDLFWREITWNWKYVWLITWALFCQWRNCDYGKNSYYGDFTDSRGDRYGLFFYLIRMPTEVTYLTLHISDVTPAPSAKYLLKFQQKHPTTTKQHQQQQQKQQKIEKNKNLI